MKEEGPEEVVGYFTVIVVVFIGKQTHWSMTTLVTSVDPGPFPEF